MSTSYNDDDNENPSEHLNDEEYREYRWREDCLLRETIPNVLLHGEPLDVGTASDLADLEDPEDDDEAWDLLARNRDDEMPDPRFVASQSSQETVDMRCKIGRNRQIVYVETPEGDIVAVDPRPHNSCHN